jgi:Zn-dependent protease
MDKLTAGSLPLFRVAGIQVSMHWSWLVVAYLEIVTRVNRYHSMTWNIAEYVSLFAIVLLHEFGHALACRQVGGKADRIVLWPLGGVAFVEPPPRPGAVLWSIAAGPLVNVVLAPISIVALLVASQLGLPRQNPDFMHFLSSLAFINAGLLFFNMLPVYPLDGGQILQSLLWFVIGQARSLMVSGIIGLTVAAGVIVLALVRLNDQWLVVMAAFIGWQAWQGFRIGTRLQKLQPTLDLMNQGVAAVRAKRFDEAVDAFTKVIDAGGDPSLVTGALTNRAIVESELGKWHAARSDYQQLIEMNGNSASAHNGLAWLLATCPADDLRDGREAVAHATLACNLSRWINPSAIGTLAAACAEAGDFAQAVRWQTRANANPAYRKAYGDEATQARLRLYEQGVPFRIAVRTS